MNEKMDKAKLLAYILGELERDETLAIAKLVQDDPELKAEVLSLQAMTQKLDEAFMVTEDHHLKASQQQRIRLRAHHRATRKKWLILGSAFATLAIVTTSVLKQSQMEKMAAQPIRETIVQAPPPTFENKVVSPPETTWEGALPAAQQSPPVAVTGKRSGVGAKQSKETGLLSAFGGTGLSKKRSDVKTAGTLIDLAPTPPALPSPTVELQGKGLDSRGETNTMLMAAESVAADDALQDSGPPPAGVLDQGISIEPEAQEIGPMAKQAPSEQLRIQVDPRLSSVPAAFHENLLSALVKNLNNSDECFSARPVPVRVDMTVEVSVKGDILSVNLIPTVPNNDKAILCLMNRIHRVGSLLKPRTNKNATFEVRINLK